MKVKVKTVWGAGLVSVSSPYVKKALDRGEGLEIECKGAVMKVSYEKLIKKNPREDRYNDRFGRRKDYELYDFFWEPGNE
jgi:hypothetical protein